MAKVLSRLCEWLVNVLEQGLSAETKAKIVQKANEQLLKEQGGSDVR